jgi:hypothetical protein
MAAFTSTLENGLLVWEMEKVLDRKCGDGGIEYLIEWKTVPSNAKTTWELYETLSVSSEAALELITEVNNFFIVMYYCLQTYHWCIFACLV